MAQPERFKPQKEEIGGKNIVFFDGVCGLCHGLVRFVLREDSDLKFLFSPLQGETFKLLADRHPETVRTDSVLVLRRSADGDDFLARSEAALFILGELPRYRFLSRIGSFCPAMLRNLFYRAIAAIRYKIWGRSLVCSIPSSEEAIRFLP
jgi:predicted DCC family thiol-disulfide oxidoreductase YuxK